MNFENTLKGQRVWVTGHTGFTGGWLVLWLKALGCRISGLALPPNTEPNLFTAANIAEGIESEFGDIRDFAIVKSAIERARPTIIFHLAAQPLVSCSFEQPIETIAINILGTAHVLEAARLSATVKAVICVTTDKVYADRASRDGYRESDSLGGNDPYSASKASAELVAGCYIANMAVRGNGCRIATARGGNIIGGGDWSRDRIVPDFVRAVISSTPLVLRRPQSVRPWQHVLALVHGYLALAGHLLDAADERIGACNFGPNDKNAVPVETLVKRLATAWTSPRIEYVKGDFPETHFLQVDSTKAREHLGWRPPLDFDASVDITAAWYRDYYANPALAHDLTLAQIEQYRRRL